MGANVKKATEEFCAQLRKFSSDLEKNCKDLRTAAETRSSIYLEDDDSPYLVDDLQQQVTKLEKETEDLESATVGTVSFHELLGHFSELYKDIKEGTALLEEELIKFGYTPVTLDEPADGNELFLDRHTASQENPQEVPANSTTSNSTLLVCQQPPQATGTAIVPSVYQATKTADRPFQPATEDEHLDWSASEVEYEHRPRSKPSSPVRPIFMNVQDLGLSAATLALLAEDEKYWDDSPSESEGAEPRTPQAFQSFSKSSYPYSNGGSALHTRETGRQWTYESPAAVGTPFATAGNLATPASGVGFEAPAGSSRFAPAAPSAGSSRYGATLQPDWTPAVGTGYNNQPNARSGMTNVSVQYEGRATASAISAMPAGSNRYAAGTGQSAPPEAPPVSSQFATPQPGVGSEIPSAFGAGHYHGAGANRRSEVPNVGVEMPGVSGTYAGMGFTMQPEAPPVSETYPASRAVPAGSASYGGYSASSAQEVPLVASGANLGAGDMPCALLHPVSAEEFEGLKSFYRGGISLPDVNGAVGLINHFLIEKRKAMAEALPGGQLPGSDTFDQEDMARLGFGAKVKAYLLVFIKLERIKGEPRGPGGAMVYRILPTTD